VGLGAPAAGAGISGTGAPGSSAGSSAGELVAVTWDLVDLLVLPATRCVPIRSEYHLQQHQHPSSPGSAVAPRPPPGSPALHPRLSGGRTTGALVPARGGNSVTATSPTGTSQESVAGQQPQVQPLPPALLSVDDVPALVSPLQRQDHDVRFRRLLAEYQNARRVAHVRGTEVTLVIQHAGSAEKMLVQAS
jgi:hypothetical protein